MNTKVMVAFLMGAALAITACVSTPQNLIVGKWEVENAPMKMTAEFKSDGTATINMFGQPAQGTYTLSPDNELTWTMNGISTKGKVTVSANELEVTNDQNQTIKYKRQ